MIWDIISLRYSEKYETGHLIPGGIFSLPSSVFASKIDALDLNLGSR